MFRFWIKVAQIQGQVYEKLFSAAAFLKPPEERAQIAKQLVNALKEAWVERGDASPLDFAFAPAGASDAVPKSASNGPDVADLPSKRNKKVVQFPTVSQQCFGDVGQARLMEPEGGKFLLHVSAPSPIAHSFRCIL
jgi:hypothetical protein